MNTEIKKFADKYREIYNQSNSELGKNVGQKWIAPVDLNKYKITSYFSKARKDPVGGKVIKPHKGIDIGVPMGTPIRATITGKVIASGNDVNGWGYYIDIDHGIINGKRILSRYAHLSQISVKMGQTVHQGEIIAKSGSSGHSSGPHLHFEIIINGQQQNPLDFIKHSTIKF